MLLRHARAYTAADRSSLSAALLYPPTHNTPPRGRRRAGRPRCATRLLDVGVRFFFFERRKIGCLNGDEISSLFVSGINDSDVCISLKLGSIGTMFLLCCSANFI